MTVLSSNISFILFFVLTFVRGTLEPDGTVSVDCGSAQTFTCRAPRRVSIGWNIAGLSGINISGPFNARNAANRDFKDRITSPDSGDGNQVGESEITISGFSLSDNGGIIQCVNKGTNSTKGMATISVDLNAPSNLNVVVESCGTVTLRWTQPSEPNDITTSVSCTPHSSDCAECTTSPCTITGLTPSTEHEFTVTLNSGGCGTSMSTAVVKTKGLGAPTNVVATVDSCDTVFLGWTQPSGPSDITTSVSCTPPSPGCAECTTSPCTITGLKLSIDYEFTVTLNSSVCGPSRNTTTALQIDASSCIASNSTSNDTSPDTSPDTSTGDTSLAALAVLTLIIPLIYPLVVLITNVCCFRDKSYCEVFWCCSCFRKDKSVRSNSTELMKSPHPRVEGEHQNVSKGKHIQFVTDGEKKDQRGIKQEHVVTYETVEQLGDDNGDVITDETVEQQGNEDGITYATLDFSGHRKGNINVVHSLTDEVTYAAV